MKNFVLRSSIVLILLCSASKLRAQNADLTGGSISIIFSDAVNSLMTASNTRMAAYTSAPYGIQIPFLGVNSGILNMTSGVGLISVTGEIGVASNTTTMRIDALSFDNFASEPCITGNLYVNDHYVVRLVVLNIVKANPLGAPFAAGQVVMTGIPLKFSTTMVGVLNSFFGIVIPAGTSAGTMGVNTALINLQ